MKKIQTLMVLAMFACGTIMLAGCGDQGATTSDDASKDASTATSTDEQQADTTTATATPYTAQMSDDGEFQLVSLKLPNMT